MEDEWLVIRVFLYLEGLENSRSSFSQVGETNAGQESETEQNRLTGGVTQLCSARNCPDFPFLAQDDFRLSQFISFGLLGLLDFIF